MNQQLADDAPARLTAVEQDILSRIASGALYKQIAAQLGISVETVANHATTIRRKTGCRDNVALTWYAIRYGLIAVEEGAAIALDEPRRELPLPPYRNQPPTFNHGARP